MNINRYIGGGNLTRDPELRYTPQGSPVCEISLAINSYIGKGENRKQETTYITATAWGSTAENAAKYLKKGSPAVIEGRLKFEQWLDKETGKTRNKLTVVADAVHFLERGQYQAPAPSQPGQAISPEQGSLLADPPGDNVPF